MSFAFGRTFIGRFLLATGLLGLAAATASAAIVFQVNGTYTTGIPLSAPVTGTLTIDPVSGTITAYNLNLGPVAGPAPYTGAFYTCQIAVQFPAPGTGYTIFLICDSGALPTLTPTLILVSDPAGDLLGYQGGPLGGPFSGTVTQGGSFQVRYASNLINGGDAVVNITNTGASASANLTPGQIVGGVNQNNINGDICVNIYTFAADEQEVACCSCLVTPNALWSASVKTALLNSTLTPAFPNEVVVKLISSAPIVSSTGTESCNPATLTNVSSLIEPGVMAWGTSLHGVPNAATGPTYQMAETPFSPATLSLAELTRDVQECQFIQILGSGQFGICKGCSNVGLGASAQ